MYVCIWTMITHRIFFTHVQLVKIGHVVKNIWRIVNTTASIWHENMLAYLSLGILISVPQRSQFSKTVRFWEQIMVTDKYPSIFLRQMEAIFLSIPCSTNIGKRTPDLLGVFLFLFYFVNNYFGGIFKKKNYPTHACWIWDVYENGYLHVPSHIHSAFVE